MFSIPQVKRVEEVMDVVVPTINENEDITKAIDEMIENDRKSLVVVNNDEDVVGILAMKDLRWIKEKQEVKQIQVKNLMSTQVVYVESGIPIDECRNLMIREEIGILPVLNGRKLLGILRQEHIRDYYYMNLEEYGITLNYIIAHIKEGISAMNSEGIVILWNDFMEKRYSIKAEDIIGRPMSDFLINTVSERVLKTRISMSDVYYTEEKKNLYGLVHANPIYYKGEFMGVVCTELDITDAKNLSNELEKSNEKIEYLQNMVKDLSKGEFNDILGKSSEIQKVKSIAKQVARTNSSIFVRGESGTGKEVFVKAIHNYSNRKGEFVAVNCSAIPNELFESEFFGYEPGAFTGANRKGKAGIFEIAKGGTVFLDEIADLPLNMQAKLLRVLQEREIRRVGGEKIIKTDVRIISATNKNLVSMVREESFREDLYYRLNVVELTLPPLRERKEDISLMANEFLHSICDDNKKPKMYFDKEAMDVMESYRWKGNIRELKNTIENIVVLTNKSIIDVEDLPGYILDDVHKEKENKDYPLDINEAIKQLEIKNIKKAMAMSEGNKAKAAQILNIPRTTLYYKLKLYEFVK